MKNRINAHFQCKDQDFRRVHVMILYDDLPAGYRAMELFSHLVEEHGDTIELNPLIWRFDLVEDPGWTEVLDQEAMRSDLFIISVGPKNGLPMPVRNWLESDLRFKRRASAAVVLLLAEDARLPDTTSSPPALEYLQNLTERSGLEFFAQGSNSTGFERHTIKIP